MECMRADIFTAHSARAHFRANTAGLRAAFGRPAARLTPRRAKVACSATTVGSNEKLKYEDLVNYIGSGCKPKEEWRIGTEHEKFGFKTKDFSRMGYPEVQQLLNGLRTRFGWEPIMEGENIIGVKLDGQSVTLEPGGQFELSGAPLDSLHKTCAEVNSHLYQVKAIAEEMDVGFLGLGFDPKWAVSETPVMPKGRYGIMKAYMPTVGSMGLDMMFRTCTVQVNLDFSSEQDMVEKLRIGLALQPIATALFANSPFKDNAPHGLLSYRSHVWKDTDNDRTGDLPWVFEDGMGFARYVDWVLDVPMYFIYRNGVYMDATGLSFRDWMEGKCPLLPGEYPTLDDWEQHLSTVFPEVRLKKFLEMRGADSGPFGRICALPALWVGLLYDDAAQAEALAMVSDWTAEERAAMKAGVSYTGLKTPFRGGTVQDLALDALRIARGGLERRGIGEEVFLKTLQANAESGMTMADELLLKYNGEWEGNINRVYQDDLVIY
uniref:Glutamate--cysteine ligase n=1 Tax=Pyramimonas obovata TaxID=1411642 RepID=A0A7S0QPH8_9CHLO|eukprot:CAMPEP_0118938840 /NCGR_PEP_ID=MMETSP1169-20130426/27232_1 /TAXON_ID=36882 /ORGANISM="Pyramimonas obovata, Strain CCMP722" /LENGTH=491 /DNA_ID=CAMNT_0006882931 /DNA_START=18 /DNA_END=1493 /DNA_ORIENTATION=-